MTTKKTNSNTQIWDAVCVTDPSIARHVGQRGGFTAICARSQLLTATQMWGPFGERWGIRNLEYEYLQIDGSILELTLMAEFYYPSPTTGEEVSFVMSDDLAYRPGGECRKKILTSLRSKMMSSLGFNSDVFEGAFEDSHRWEDNRYVNVNEDMFQRATAAIEEADSLDRLDKIRAHMEEADFTAAQLATLKRGCTRRAKALQPKEEPANV